MAHSRLLLAATLLAAGSSATGAFGQSASKPVPVANCPPGYTCTPAPQPPQMQPRALSPEEIEGVRGDVVDETLNSILSPEEIGSLRDRSLKAQSAANWLGMSGDGPPTARPRVLRVEDLTQRIPDSITLALGIVTPITFLDRNGKPWPIERLAYDPRVFAQDGVGCGANAPQQQDAEQKVTTITLMPCLYQTFGNITVKLRELPTPIVLMVKSGFGGPVDLPVTVSLLRDSPEAAAKARLAAQNAENARREKELRRAYLGDARNQRKNGEDPELDAFLTAVPPQGARSLPTSNPAVSAWLYGGRLYVRGPVAVLTPAYDAMGSGDDGQHVYRFSQPVGRTRVVLDDGSEQSLSIGL